MPTCSLPACLPRVFCRLEVVGDRELAFFPGAGVGSIYAGFQYESEAGAVAAPLRFRDRETELEAAAATDAAAGASGGGAGVGGSGAANGSTSGSGSSAALGGGKNRSGPAADGSSASGDVSSSERQRWKESVDYVNGGPGFRLLSGAPLPTALLAAQQHTQGRQAPARLPAEQPDLQPPAQQQQQQPSEQQAGTDGQHQHQLAGIQLLAVYPEHRDAAAALLCHVGARGGRAVLCSSHPELHPSWLSGRAPAPACSSSIAGSDSSGGGGSRGGGCAAAAQQAAPAAAAAAATAEPPACVDTVGGRVAAVSAHAAALSGEGHVQRLQAELLSAQQGRWTMWRSLLVAAGLRPWMHPRSS